MENGRVDEYTFHENKKDSLLNYNQNDFLGI